jgi:hypothetical protein
VRLHQALKKEEEKENCSDQFKQHAPALIAHSSRSFPSFVVLGPRGVLSWSRGDHRGR